LRNGLLYLLTLEKQFGERVDELSLKNHHRKGILSALDVCPDWDYLPHHEHRL